jgi:hypothetical protein
MRIIPTRLHGVLDYLIGIILVIAPFVLHFEESTAATYVPVILGAAAIVYSLFTDYELGMFKALSMRAHLWLDLLSGVVLAASPWLFGFSDYVYLPHLVLGIVEILASLMTKKTPYGSLMMQNR